MEIKDVDVKLKKIIKDIIRFDILDDNVEKMLDDSECDLMDDLGFDSLLMVQLIVEVENTFKLEFSLEDLDINILSKYTNLKNYIIKKI